MTADARTSAEIARDAEQQREGLSQTLGQLARKMSPGEIVDDVWNLARRSNGGQFVKNFGRDLRDHPLPLALIGTGIAWMMLPRRTGPKVEEDAFEASSVTEPSPYDYRQYQGKHRRVTAASLYTDDVNDKKHVAADGQKDLGGDPDGLGVSKTEGVRSSIAGTAKDGIADLGSSVGEAVSHAASTTHDALDRMSSTASHRMSAASHQARHAGSQALHTARDLSSSARNTGNYATIAVRGFVSQQPLAAAAIGFACGAVIASMFKTTQTEDRLVGDMSDSLKQEAKDRAEGGFEAAVQATHRAVEGMADEAEKQGLTPNDLRESVAGLRDRTAAVIDRGAQSIAGENSRAQVIAGEAREVLPVPSGGKEDQRAAPRKLGPEDAVPQARDTIDGEPV